MPLTVKELKRQIVLRDRRIHEYEAIVKDADKELGEAHTRIAQLEAELGAMQERYECAVESGL